MKNKVLQTFSFYDYSDIEISFSIKTKALDLQSLTDFLNLTPTRGWTNGEKYIGKQRNTETNKIETIERRKPNTLFVYETKGIVDSTRFQDHAAHLLDKLDAIKENLMILIAQSDKFEVLIKIYLKFDKDQPYFGFSAESNLLNRLSTYCHLIEWRNN